VSAPTDAMSGASASVPRRMWSPAGGAERVVFEL
jgi:hypothetical protein